MMKKQNRKNVIGKRNTKLDVKSKTKIPDSMAIDDILTGW